jgi:hypothetical protein
LINQSYLRRDFLLVTLAFTCFALLPEAPAVDPPPDGGDLAGNKAERTNTLFTLTTGSANTGLEEVALYSNTTGNDKTASGQAALSNNTTGSNKVGLGFQRVQIPPMAGIISISATRESRARLAGSASAQRADKQLPSSPAFIT